MSLFQNAIEDAIDEFQKLPDFNVINEVTIIRDVHGKLSFTISAATPVDIDGARTKLTRRLGKHSANQIIWMENNPSGFTKQIIREVLRSREPLNVKSTPIGCQWYLVERTIAKKSWMDHSHRHLSIWPYEDALAGKKPKVISFYSFKGGMGRTTALAATAYCLAGAGKNVLLVDTDIEAPGLATIFLNEGQIDQGVVDYFLERQADESFHADGNIQRYIAPFRNPQIEDHLSGTIFVIPAGKADDDYLKKLSRVDCQDIRRDNIKNTLTELVKEAVSWISSHGFGIDYVLMDARAGFHDIGGVVLSQLPHGAVLFGRGDAQSWNGLKEAIRLAATAQNDRISILLVDSMFNDADSGSAEEKHAFKMDAFMYCREPYYEEDALPGIDAENEAHSPVFIPYTPALNGTITLISDGSAGQEQRVETLTRLFCGTAYEEIVQRIRDWFHDRPDELQEGMA